MLSLSVFSEATFGGWLNVLLSARFSAPGADKTNWSVGLAQERCRSSLSYTEKMLGDAPYLAGARFTIADIAVGGCFGMFAVALGEPLPEKLAAYRARLESRPAQQRALTRAVGGSA